MTRRVGMISLLLGLCTLGLAGCGARWTDDQAELIAARDQKTSADQPVATSRSSSATTTPTRSQMTSPTGATGGDGPEPVGDESASQAEVGRGETPGTDDGAAAGPACAAPSEAPGVSATTIEVLSISSLSGPSPGLGASAAAATRSYVSFLNSTGGVCGRQIVLREVDDGTDVGRYRSIVQESAPSVFGIASGFTAADVGGREVLGKTGIPLVTVVSQDTLAELPNVFDTNPGYETTANSSAKYRYMYAEGARRAAFVYIAVDQSRALADVERQLVEAAGIEVVLVKEAPLSTLNWDSAARAVANSKADLMVFIADTGANASMARSLAGVDHDLEFPDYFTLAYETSFIDQAGPAAEGATTWLRTLPNTDASSNEQVALFIEWMDRAAPGEIKDQFGADGWTSAKTFFDILARIPGPISREAFIETARSIETYDAGGMLGPIRLGRGLTNGCIVGMQVRSGAWARLAPTSGFLC